MQTSQRQPPTQPARRETAMRIAVCLMALLLIPTLGVIFGAFLSTERIEPPVRVGIEHMRGTIHARLLNLSRANNPQLAAVGLKELRREVATQQHAADRLRERHPEAQSDLATTLAIHDLIRDLQALGYTAAEWSGWMEDAILTPVEQTERLLVGALDTLQDWPRQWTPKPPPRRWRLVMNTQLAFLGLRDGLGAPLRPLLMARYLDSSLYRPRNLLFPYRQPPNWLYAVGFALAATLAGYALCWVGMRLVRPWIAYAGLLYFVATLVFLTGLITIHAGLLK